MNHYRDENWAKILLPSGNKLINLTTGEEETMQPISKMFACELKDFSEKDKSFTAIASTEAIDRDGDILLANGWKLKNYRKNPSFLWGHQSSALPIGKSLETWVEDKKLMFRPQFATEIYPFAETVWKMYREKILRSFSVRFDPIVSEDRELTDEEKKRYNTLFYTPQVYKSQDLLEISAVNVGSNTEAMKSVEMLDFVVKSYYAQHPEVFPGIDFNKQIWNGTDFIKDKLCTDCCKTPKDFTEDLKDKYVKIEKLKSDKERKVVEKVLDVEIKSLEDELENDNAIETLAGSINTIQETVSKLKK